jgi:eukaryotic-like serine/threonine-protein kinase
VPVLAIIAVLAAGGVVLALALREGVERTQRGTGPGKIEAPPGDVVISLKRTAATDYDPLGDEQEHSEEAPLVVDRAVDTTWTTESYSAGLEGAGKTGVGIHVDADPGIAATGIEIRTPEPGFRAEIHAARGDEPPGELDGWTRLDTGTVRRERQTFELDTEGTRYRYYLVWITELAEGAERAEIAEIALTAPEDQAGNNRR